MKLTRKNILLICFVLSAFLVVACVLKSKKTNSLPQKKLEKAHIKNDTLKEISYDDIEENEIIESSKNGWIGYTDHYWQVAIFPDTEEPFKARFRNLKNSKNSIQIDFINENIKMREALKIITRKKLGVLIVRNNSKILKGIISDGDIRRYSEKKGNLDNLKVKNIMTKNPISIDQNELAAKALNLMTSKKKITSLCVHKTSKRKTIGILHIHHILLNISVLK